MLNICQGHDSDRDATRSELPVIYLSLRKQGRGKSDPCYPNSRTIVDNLYTGMEYDIRE